MPSLRPWRACPWTGSCGCYRRKRNGREAVGRRRYVALINSLSRATIPSKNRFYIGEVVTSGFHPAHFQFAHWRRFDNVSDLVCVTSNSYLYGTPRSRSNCSACRAKSRHCRATSAKEAFASWSFAYMAKRALQSKKYYTNDHLRR